MPTLVNQSEPARCRVAKWFQRRVTRWFRRRVLLARSPWEPRAFWHGVRGDQENFNVCRVRKTKLRVMKTRNLHRKPALIVNARWAAYATAGAASAFTCANSAEAAIHYSGFIGSFSGQNGTKGLTVQLDQPGDSFLLRRYVTFFTSDAYAHFGVRGLTGAGFAGFYCPTVPQVASVSNLGRGQFI